MSLSKESRTEVGFLLQRFALPLCQDGWKKKKKSCCLVAQDCLHLYWHHSGAGEKSVLRCCGILEARKQMAARANFPRSKRKFRIVSRAKASSPKAAVLPRVDPPKANYWWRLLHCGAVEEKGIYSGRSRLPAWAAKTPSLPTCFAFILSLRTHICRNKPFLKPCRTNDLHFTDKEESQIFNWFLKNYMYFWQRWKTLFLVLPLTSRLLGPERKKNGPQDWSCRDPGKRGHYHATAEFCQLSS